jgi:hypothetical protein
MTPSSSSTTLESGENATFTDWYADDTTAISDARSHFTAKGYHVNYIAARHGEVKAERRILPTLQAKILSVHLTTHT